MLDTSFALGLNFLLTWQAWRTDPQRPRLLHFVSMLGDEASKAELLREASDHPELLPLADELAAQWNGLLAGTHRLAFDGGRVMLTLGVGDASSWAWLKAQGVCADSVYLDGISHHGRPWTMHMFKALARCCHTGTRVTSGTAHKHVREGLQQCGFILEEPLGLPSEHDPLQAVFNPPWQPRQKTALSWPKPRSAQTCLVIGAGLAGAAAAASLARRGWQVTVLDAEPAPAGGASSLPAGFLAPHVSPDDGILSRLSRSGLRATWQAVAELLQAGDGQRSGVLQRRFDASSRLPADWPETGAHWSQEAAPALLDEECKADAQAPLWHGAGGWVKPARLVEALLNTPGVTWRCGQAVSSLRRAECPADTAWSEDPAACKASSAAPNWQALDAQGKTMAEACLVVVAAGPGSVQICASGSVQAPPLQPVRGQIVWGAWPIGVDFASFESALPTSPVNGLGGLIPVFPSPRAGEPQPHWLLGATFERGESQPLIRAEDTAQLQDRLTQLWPPAAKALASQISAGQAQSWPGVRCSSPDRLPLVGPLDDKKAPGLWLCTAMGSRGLTFAVLCGELLAAWANDEPLPLEKRLAQHLLASRFNPR